MIRALTTYRSMYCLAAGIMDNLQPIGENMQRPRLSGHLDPSKGVKFTNHCIIVNREYCRVGYQKVGLDFQVILLKIHGLTRSDCTAFHQNGSRSYGAIRIQFALGVS